MKKILLPFLLLIINFSLFTTGAKAQSAVGLSIIPPRLEVTAQPGEVITKQIKIRNESNVEKIVSTTSRDFIVTDDAGTPIQLETSDPATNRWAASSWIQVSPSELKILPGETKSLMVTVIVPDDALSGGHYAMILHTPANDVILNQSGSAITTNVGTLVYITVPGDIKQAAQVKNFTAPSFSEYGPINFSATVTNLSDIHITPVGSVVVTNWFNRKTASIPLQSLNIFPYASRDYTSLLDKKFLFGRYKAQFIAAYGTTGNVALANIFFWVIPWKLLILVLTAIIILIVLFTLLRRQSTLTPASSDNKISELEQELDDLKKKYRDRK